MPEFSYPGIYNTREKGIPSAPQGVSPSIMGAVGFTLEGKVDEIINATSFPEFVNRCGGFTSKGILPLSVFNFYQNGGRNVKIVRTVGDGADKSSGYFYTSKVGEIVTVSPLPDASVADFVFAALNTLESLPLVPGSLVVTDSGAGEIFTDQSDGTLLGSTPGSTGTIDYLTGEGTLHYAGGSEPAVGVTFGADYNYKTFGFDLLWEGDAGNEFRVSIEGDSNYSVPVTSSYSRYIVNIERENSEIPGTYDVVEQFKGISLTDPTDAKFISTAMNDDIVGSSYVIVTAYGNNISPVNLSGVQVTGETLVPAPIFDGTTRSFVYTLGNDINPLSLNMNINPSSVGDAVGTPAVGVTFNGTLPQLPDVSAINTVRINVEIGGSVETYVNSVTPLVLVGSDSGGTGTGTIDALGNFALTTGGGNFDAVACTADYNWSTPMVIKDDGMGNAYIDSGGGGVWLLDPNATNEVDYDAGTVSVTYKYIASPIVGPSAPDGTIPTLAWIQTTDYYAQPISSSVYFDMTGGNDGLAVTRSDISGASLLASGKGIFALSKTDDILQVSVPDFETDYLVVKDVIDYCNSRFDRFFIYTVPETLEYDAAINWKKNIVNKNNYKEAACYYPHIKMLDPISEVAINVPTSGHIAGLYARVFNEINTSQVPAGIEYGALKGLVALERSLTESQVGACNLESVNCLVDWANTGLCAWGGRTNQVNGDMPYISMVQTEMYTRKVLNIALYKFVFGSNNASFRNRIRLNISSILLTMYGADYFLGATAAEAFYVICDGSNNTQATIDKGEVWVEVGVALKKPGEFIVLKLKQILQSS